MMTVADVAALLGWSTSKTYTRARNGTLPPPDARGPIRWHAATIVAWAYVRDAQRPTLDVDAVARLCGIGAVDDLDDAVDAGQLPPPDKIYPFRWSRWRLDTWNAERCKAQPARRRRERQSGDGQPGRRQEHSAASASAPASWPSECTAALADRPQDVDHDPDLRGLRVREVDPLAKLKAAYACPNFRRPPHDQHARRPRPSRFDAPRDALREQPATDIGAARGRAGIMGHLPVPGSDSTAAAALRTAAGAVEACAGGGAVAAGLDDSNRGDRLDARGGDVCPWAEIPATPAGTCSTRRVVDETVWPTPPACGAVDSGRTGDGRGGVRTLGGRVRTVAARLHTVTAAGADLTSDAQGQTAGGRPRAPLDSVSGARYRERV